MTIQEKFLIQILKANAGDFAPVVPFNPAKEKLARLDLTKNNTTLTEEVYSNTKLFAEYINQQRRENNSAYLIGGYNEERELYKRSVLFDFEKKLTVESPSVHEKEEPRRLHLGIDIWGDAGTPVFAPLGGVIHSFAFNNNFGDYGATIILQHNIDTTTFHTLYGHVSLKDFKDLRKGGYITRGQPFAHFGTELENGKWPPHLHFQIIDDIGLYEGDYPGVCKISEKGYYLRNCPDPDLILQLMKFVNP